jgi:hypothetical protein
VSDLEGPHFHVGMTSLAWYVQYLFNLQHNTTKTGMQQRTRLTTYEESATTTAHKTERLRHENDILRSGARPPSEQGHELQEDYRRLSDAEHGWNYTHMLLDICHTRFEAKSRCSSYACPRSSCHTYDQNVNIENQCLYYINIIT